MSKQIVEVLHRLDPEDLLEHQRDQRFYRHAYRYHRMREFNLSEIWRENNVVDGNELPVTFATRSLMVGDVVRVTLNGTTTDWQVEKAGWSEVVLEGAKILSPWELVATHNTAISLAWGFDHPGEFDENDNDQLWLAVRALHERVAEIDQWMAEGNYGEVRATIFADTWDTYELDAAEVVTRHG